MYCTYVDIALAHCDSAKGRLNAESSCHHQHRLNDLMPKTEWKRTGRGEEEARRRERGGGGRGEEEGEGRRRRGGGRGERGEGRGERGGGRSYSHERLWPL